MYVSTHVHMQVLYMCALARFTSLKENVTNCPEQKMFVKHTVQLGSKFLSCVANSAAGSEQCHF